MQSNWEGEKMMTKKQMLEEMLKGGNEAQMQRIIADRVKRCKLDRVRNVYGVWLTHWQYLQNGRQLVINITAF